MRTPDSASGSLSQAAQHTATSGTFVGSSPERWLQALAAAGAGVTVLWVMHAITERRLAKLAEQTDTIADDFAVGLVCGIKTSLFVLVALAGIDAFIVFPPPAAEAVRSIKILALVLQGFAWKGSGSRRRAFAA